MYLSCKPIVKPHRPVILVIAAQAAAAECGLKFDAARDGVYVCTETIPVDYLRRRDDDWNI